MKSTAKYNNRFNIEAVNESSQQQLSHNNNNSQTAFNNLIHSSYGAGNSELRVSSAVNP